MDDNYSFIRKSLVKFDEHCIPPAPPSTQSSSLINAKQGSPNFVHDGDDEKEDSVEVQQGSLPGLIQPPHTHSTSSDIIFLKPSSAVKSTESVEIFEDDSVPIEPIKEVVPSLKQPPCEQGDSLQIPEEIFVDCLDDITNVIYDQKDIRLVRKEKSLAISNMVLIKIDAGAETGSGYEIGTEENDNELIEKGSCSNTNLAKRVISSRILIRKGLSSKESRSNSKSKVNLEEISNHTEIFVNGKKPSKVKSKSSKVKTEAGRSHSLVTKQKDPTLNSASSSKTSQVSANKVSSTEPREGGDNSGSNKYQRRVSFLRKAAETSKNPPEPKVMALVRHQSIKKEKGLKDKNKGRSHTATDQYNNAGTSPGEPKNTDGPNNSKSQRRKKWTSTLRPGSGKKAGSDVSSIASAYARSPSLLYLTSKLVIQKKSGIRNETIQRLAAPKTIHRAPEIQPRVNFQATPCPKKHFKRRVSKQNKMEVPKEETDCESNKNNPLTEPNVEEIVGEQKINALKERNVEVLMKRNLPLIYSDEGKLLAKNFDEHRIPPAPTPPSTQSSSRINSKGSFNFVYDEEDEQEDSVEVQGSLPSTVQPPNTHSTSSDTIFLKPSSAVKSTESVEIFEDGFVPTEPIKEVVSILKQPPREQGDSLQMPEEIFVDCFDDDTEVIYDQKDTRLVRKEKNLAISNMVLIKIDAGAENGSGYEIGDEENELIEKGPRSNPNLAKRVISSRILIRKGLTSNEGTRKKSRSNSKSRVKTEEISNHTEIFVNGKKPSRVKSKREGGDNSDSSKYQRRVSFLKKAAETSKNPPEAKVMALVRHQSMKKEKGLKDKNMGRSHTSTDQHNNAGPSPGEPKNDDGPNNSKSRRRKKWTSTLRPGSGKKAGSDVSTIASAYARSPSLLYLTKKLIMQKKSGIQNETIQRLAAPKTIHRAPETRPRVHFKATPCPKTHLKRRDSKQNKMEAPKEETIVESNKNSMGLKTTKYAVRNNTLDKTKIQASISSAYSETGGLSTKSGTGSSMPFGTLK